MRRKAICAVGAACALVGATLFTFVAPAGAQYPPGPCVPNSSGDSGTVAVGGTINVILDPNCVWDSGAPVAVAVNGTPIPGKTADAGGSVGVAITALSQTQLSVDDPVLTPAQCGTNVVTGSGPSRVAQGTSTHTETFTLLCPGVTPARATVARAGTGTRVALTGANLARWGAIAFGLVVVGGLFVAADRRKARARG